MNTNYSKVSLLSRLRHYAVPIESSRSLVKKKSAWGVIAFFMMLCLFPTTMNGQLITNYTFSTGTNGSLEDISVGATTLLTGNVDSGATPVTPIGFDFYFMGVKYTHFSANSNGQVRLHQAATESAISTTTATIAANTALLLPMSGDNEVNGGMRSKLVGGKMVIEWTQFYAHYSNNLTNAGNMQVWLSPNGKIDYVYGEIYNATNAVTTRSIGLASSNTATTAGSITLSATPTFSAGATFATNAFAAGSSTVTGSPLIANLGSSDNNSRRFFSFTPSALPVASPVALTFSLVQTASTTVNWQDNSSNESSFIVTRATDAAFTTGVVNTQVPSTSSAGTGTAYSLVQTGLLPSTAYYYKVIAASEGSVSPDISGTATTTAPGTFISIASGNFNAASTWDVNVVPSIYDNAIVATGHNVSVNATGLQIANLTVQGTLSYGAGTSFAINGNLTVEPAGTVNVFTATTGKSLTVSGNIVNNGIIDLSVGATTEGQLVLNGTSVQTVNGTGSFNTNVIRNLAFNNTNTAIPNINWQFNNIKIANNLDFTGSKVNLGSNKLTFGNNAVGGTLTVPAGTGLLSGAKFSRWWSATTAGATITAGSDPTGPAGRYPFLSSTGINRSMWIARTNTTGAAAGEIAVVYNDASTSTTGLTIVDGAYTVNERFNGNWTVSNEGTAVSASSYALAIAAPQAYYISNGNSRIIYANGPISGTHQNGTATPGAQRVTVTQADLFAAPLYIGSGSSDVPFVSVTNGNWDIPSTWNKNAVPTATDNVSIASGTTVTTNGANVANTLTVLSGGLLNVSTGTLSVTSNITNASNGNLTVNGGTLNLSVAGTNNRPFVNNGVLTVTSGTINLFGNLLNSANSTFSQSGGEIIIDGNNAGIAASSVPTGTNILAFNSNLVTLTGGKITVVDPHVGTATSDYTVSYSQGTIANATSGHTIQFGNGVSTDATTNTGGFIFDPYISTQRLNFGNMILNTNISTSNRLVTIPEGLGLHGSLTINSGSELRATGLYMFAIAGNIVNNGTLTSSIASLVFGGVDLTAVTSVPNPNAQNVSGTGVFRNSATTVTANLANLTINNGNAAGVTLNVPLSVSGTLTLTNGVTNTTNTNILSLGTATAAGTLSGGSATAYVKGPFTRTIANGNTAYILYPVGKTAYAPIALAPTTTAVATMKAEAFDTNTGTMDASIIDLSATRRWEAPLLTGTVTDVKVRIGDAGIIATTIPVQSPAADGVYTSAFGPTATFTAGTPNTSQSNAGIASANYTGFISYAVSNSCAGTPAPGNTIASATSICFGSSVNLSLQNATAGSGVTYVWESSTDGTTFAPIASATSATYSATPTVATYYRAQVTCSGVTTASTPVQVSFTNNILTTTPASICGLGTATLQATATAGSDIKWYAQATGGTAVGTGASFTTPSISATTSYWAEASTIGGAVTVGPASPTAQGGTTGDQTIAWDVSFTALQATTLTSVDVFPLASGQTASIAVRNSSGTVLATYPFTTNVSGGATAQTVVINHVLAPGSYQLYPTLPSSGIKRNVTGAVYPYTSSVANITANGYDPTYFMGFYNWKFASSCNSPRVEVAATVTPAPALTLSGNPVAFCSGQSSSVVTLTSTAADYNNYVWSPATGVTGDANTGWTFNPTISTSYTLTATQTAGSQCTAVATLNVSVNPLPTAITVSPSPAIVCENTILPLVVSGGTVGVAGKIGSGIAANTTSTPFKGNWGASKSQALYTAAELSALGLQAGQKVNSIGYVSLSGTPLAFNNFTITAGFVSASTLGTSFISGATTVVYGPATYTPASGTGNLDFPISASLIWDGVSNLLVETCFNNNNSGGSAATSLSIQSSTVASGLNLYRSQDNTADSCSNSATPTGATNRPNLRISTLENANLTWSPVTNLYSDAAATVPYLAGTNASTVYFKSSTAAAAVTYTATATTPASCSISSTVDVTVNAVVTPDFAAIPAFCSGSTAPTLATTSPNGVTGTWNPATVSNTASGSYVFTPSAGQCATTQTLTVTVNTTAAPTGTSPQDYTTGETLADFDVTGTGIVWYDAPTNGNVLPASTPLVSNVTYYASQTVNGCESPTRLAVTAGQNLKVDSVNFKSLKYYPNPVNNVLTVSYSQEITGLKLYNMVGQQLMVKKANATETQLDMSNIPAGSYLLEVSSGANSKTVKLLKN